jgi:hypothetical protein
MSDGASISSNLLCISFVRHQTDALFFAESSTSPQGYGPGVWDRQGTASPRKPLTTHDHDQDADARSAALLPGCSKYLSSRTDPMSSERLFSIATVGESVKGTNWKAISTTVDGRKIEGEYAVSGHLVKVRHEDRERGGDLGDSDPETTARRLLRELAEEGHA